ncbi:MAG: hypothetical protein WAK13_11555 [Terriglobales bacterium]
MSDTNVSDMKVLTVSESWPWPDSLDALVAAPKHHTLLLEDERVRVLLTTIPPNDIVPLHTHRSGGVAYVQSFSQFIRRDEQGNVLFDSRLAGEAPAVPCAQWMPPLPPHTVENLGPLEISILIVEIKTPIIRQAPSHNP